MTDTRTLPAAAIQKGDEVTFLDNLRDDPGSIVVARIENSTPTAGLMAWEDTRGRYWTVSASERVAIVRLAR